MESFPIPELFRVEVFDKTVQDLIFTRDCSTFRQIVYDNMLSFYSIRKDKKDGKERTISVSNEFSDIMVNLEKPGENGIFWEKDVVNQIIEELKGYGWKCSIQPQISLTISKEISIMDSTKVEISF